MASKIDTKKVEDCLSNLGRKDSKGKILFQRNKKYMLLIILISKLKKDLFLD